MLDRRPARVTGRQVPPRHLRWGSGSGAIYQRATHRFCGRGRKTKTEADFVLFNGLNRSRDNALMVVEAKNTGKKIGDYIGQARSYAMFLGTPYFLVTNGDDIRVFLYRSPIESDVEVFKSTRMHISSTFQSLYNLVSKKAIVEYKRQKSTV